MHPREAQRIGRGGEPGQGLAGERRGDELGGHRRQQDAVAEVAGGPDEARRARRGRSPAGCRASPGAGPRSAPRSRARRCPGRARSCRAGARRRRPRSASCPTRAPPSSRPARSGRRRAGRSTPARRGSCAPPDPGPEGSRRRRTWPLTGRTGTRACSGSSNRATSTPAATTTCDAAMAEPFSSRTPTTFSPTTSQPRDARGDAGAGEDAGERGDEQPRVHRVVAVDAQREPDRRRQRGLDLARLRRAQALERQAELGAGRRRAGPAPRPRRGRAPPRACPCCDSPAPPARRRTPRSGGRSPGPARAAPAHRTRPPRRGRACPRRRATRRASPGRSPPPARHAAKRATRRRARSRHHRRRRRRSSQTALTLRLRPPYAGTTRIRFDGRRPGGALSARQRAPVLRRTWYPLVGDAT